MDPASDCAWFRDIVNAQAAIANAETGAGGAPFFEVSRFKVAIEGRLVAPQLADVDQAGVQHMLRVAVFVAAVFGAAGFDHAPHGGTGGVEMAGGHADGSYDQQHTDSLTGERPEEAGTVSRTMKPVPPALALRALHVIESMM